MSRARKIDPQTAVQAAMEMFWKHGYGTLGTRQLEEETGITRFTLQTSYGGKFSLFLSALDNYLDLFEEHALPSASEGTLDSIATWFENRAEPEMFADVACYGCLMLNSTVEFAAQNLKVNERTMRYFKLLRGSFRNALNGVKENGGVSQVFDVDAMAEVLIAAAIGLNIVIRSAAENSAGREMAGSIAKLVRGWEGPLITTETSW